MIAIALVTTVPCLLALIYIGPLLLKMLFHYLHPDCTLPTSYHALCFSGDVLQDRSRITHQPLEMTTTVQKHHERSPYQLKTFRMKLLNRLLSGALGEFQGFLVY